MLSGCFIIPSNSCQMLRGKTRSHCYQKLAVSKNDPWLCERATEGGTKSKCYIMMAEKTFNPSICNNIPENSAPPQYTREMCIQRVAQMSGRTDLCNELEGYNRVGNDLSTIGYGKEECLRAVAEEGVPIPLPEIKCGDYNEPCCTDVPCESETARCYNEKCVTCGYKEGDFCCEGDKCNSNMLACQNDKCVKCGGEDQICCPGNECEENYFGTQMKCVANKCRSCGYIGLKRCHINGVEQCYEGSLSENGMCI